MTKEEIINIFIKKIIKPEKELFFKPSFYVEPYKPNIARCSIELDDIDTGKGILRCSNKNWWAENHIYRMYEVDSYEEIFKFLRNNPVGNSTVMKLVNEYFNLSESIKPISAKEALNEALMLSREE